MKSISLLHSAASKKMKIPIKYANFYIRLSKISKVNHFFQYYWKVFQNPCTMHDLHFSFLLQKVPLFEVSKVSNNFSGYHFKKLVFLCKKSVFSKKYMQCKKKKLRKIFWAEEFLINSLIVSAFPLFHE